MKKVFLAACILTSYNFAISQATTGSSIQKDFGMISNLGKAQSGFESFQTYSSKAVNGSQFLPDTWSEGSVTTSNNITISSNYLFLYDKVNQNLYIKVKDSNLVVVTDKQQVSYFTFKGDKNYLFAKASIYDSSASSNFLQVLVAGNYTLLKSIITTYEKADPNDLERARSGDHSDAFVDHEVYYIYYNHKLQKIKLNENSLRKAIPNNTKLNDYLNLHEESEINEAFLINLITGLN